MHKKCVIKQKLKFEDFNHCFEETYQKMNQNKPARKK